MAAQQYDQKIPIVIFGTDQKGEMFQEDTTTITVAATWAKVRLRHALAPDAELIVFNKENGNQAEFVIEQAGAKEATLLLRDHNVDLWQLDFGETIGEPEEGVDAHIECARCQTRECVKLTDDQFNQLLAAARVRRYCAKCMAETDWEEDSVVDAREHAAKLAAAAAAPPPPLPAEVATAPVAPAVAAPAAQAAAPVPTPAAVEKSGAERRTSRRIYLKTRARVRRAGSSEVVEPVNVSRGGICFESRASYELDEVIWVSMHYRDGDKSPLETTSRIVRVSRAAGDKPTNYGVSFQV